MVRQPNRQITYKQMEKQTIFRKQAEKTCHFEHFTLLIIGHTALFVGKIGQPFTTTYSATKFALDGFFGSLRQEFRLKGCDVSITMCVIGLVGTFILVD